MGQVAHIRYDGGALLLPAQNPYDRELVFEEAESCARRHGTVDVQFGRKEMWVRSAALDARDPCEECREPVGLLSFLVDHHHLCAHCAKRRMGCTL